MPVWYEFDREHPELEDCSKFLIETKQSKIYCSVWDVVQDKWQLEEFAEFKQYIDPCDVVKFADFEKY